MSLPADAATFFFFTPFLKRRSAETCATYLPALSGRAQTTAEFEPISAAVTPYVKPCAARAPCGTNTSPAGAAASAAPVRHLAFKFSSSKSPRVDNLHGGHWHNPVAVFLQPSCRRALFTYSANAGRWVKVVPSKRLRPANRKMPVRASDERL